MESSIQTKTAIVRTPGRKWTARAMLAIGGAIMLGFLVYSAFVTLTNATSFFGAHVGAYVIGGPAGNAGIKTDDLITHVNGIKLKSLEQVGQIFANSRGQAMSWTLRRYGESRNIDVLATTNLASHDGQDVVAGVYLSGLYKGRKDLILDVLPVAYVGAGFLALGLVIGLGLKRTKQRIGDAAA